MSDVGTVLWKETREAYLRKGRPSQAAWSAASLVLLGGVVVPFVAAGLMRDVDDADAERLLVTAIVVGGGMIGALFVGLTLPPSIVLDQFAGERERHTMETLLAGPLPDRAILWGKLLVPVLGAASLATAMGLLQGLVLLALVGSGGILALLLAPAFGLAALAVALPASAAGAAIGIKAKSVKAAQQTYGLLLVPFFLGAQALIGVGLSPLARRGTVGPASIALIVVGGLLAYALVTGLCVLWADRRFRRPRLLGRPE